MSMGAKALLAFLFVFAVAFVFLFVFQNPEDVKQIKDDIVFSTQDILNSDKINILHREAAKRSRKDTEAADLESLADAITTENFNNVEKDKQTNTQTHLNKLNISNSAEHKNEYTTDDTDWKINALLNVDYSSQNSNVTNEGALYQDPKLFINYSFDSKRNYYQDSGANTKYITEKEYLNILAVVLLKYQYENNTGRAVELFSSWFSEKNPKGKKQVIKEANDYIKIAEILNNASRVPDSFKGIHYRLARSYKKAGEEMLLLANDMSDDEKLKVLERYSNAANSIAKAYIAISDMIDILGLKFDEKEPANIFVFPGQKIEWSNQNI